jgi:hypothetical protein
MNEIENCLILSLWKKKVNKRKMNSTREPKHGRILLAQTGLAGKGGDGFAYSTDKIRNR